jgi:preprotein translocase SecF subunit
MNTARMDQEIEAGVTLVTTAMRDAKLPPFEVAGSRMVGAAIGADLQKKGVLATAASLAGISAYIALRFRPSFAAGAIVATAHDLVVTVAMLGAFGYDLSLNTVAAILTIAGYSVNDTIVIFDRVRENLRSARGMSIAAAVNLAVNQTLGRTIITAGATFLSVLALFLFGGEVLRGFAFAMLVGIVTGTYSTVFVPRRLRPCWRRRDPPPPRRVRLCADHIHHRHRRPYGDVSVECERPVLRDLQLRFRMPVSAGQLASRPSKGICQFAMAFQIERGKYAAVTLDGLGFIVLGLTPEEMGKGKLVSGARDRHARRRRNSGTRSRRSRAAPPADRWPRSRA